MKTKINYNKMSDIMTELRKMGYDNGDNIPYYDLVETCDSLGISPDDNDIDLDYMETMYDVAIG